MGFEGLFVRGGGTHVRILRGVWLLYEWLNGRGGEMDSKSGDDKGGKFDTLR